MEFTVCDQGKSAVPIKTSYDKPIELPAGKRIFVGFSKMIPQMSPITPQNCMRNIAKMTIFERFFIFKSN